MPGLKKEGRLQVSLSENDQMRLAALAKRMEISPQAVIRFFLRQAYEAMGSPLSPDAAKQGALFEPRHLDGATPVSVPIPKPPQGA